MSKTRLLIVEDHSMLRKILAGTLTQIGYDVEIAVNGDEAIAALQSGLEVDVVLSDIRMPGKANGIDVAQWVQEHRPRCIILLMSAYSDIDTKGFTLLSKPFSDDDVRIAIEREAKIRDTTQPARP